MTDAHLTMLISWALTGIAGAFGVGVGYGVIREQLKSFKTEFKTYKETATSAAAAAAIVASEQLTTIKERVSKVEGRVEWQVPYDRCRDMRDDCNKGREDSTKAITTQILDLSRQISETRAFMTAALSDLQKIVGRVEAHMDRNGAKGG